jgi:hypothetical protein
MARRKPRDWERFAEQLKLRAGRGADPTGGDWTLEKDRVPWRWRKIVWPKPSG